MKLALECPTGLLNEIQPLADFDWILAHLVNEDKEYAEYYAQSKRFKVLDNSVNELYAPCTLDYLSRAFEKVKPNLVVAPDFLGDAEATMNALDEAIKRFGLFKVLPVVQGATLGEVVDCTRYIHEKCIARVAVPYDILTARDDDPEVMASNRIEVVKVIAPAFRGIHLLGFTTIKEFSSYDKRVKSVDTGVPVMMGLKGKRLDIDSLDNKKKPTLDRMPVNADWANLKELANVYYNVAYLRKVLNGAR